MFIFDAMAYVLHRLHQKLFNLYSQLQNLIKYSILDYRFDLTGRHFYKLQSNFYKFGTHKLCHIKHTWIIFLLE